MSVSFVSVPGSYETGRIDNLLLLFQLQHFITMQPDLGRAEAALNQAVETVQFNIKWYRNYYPHIVQWLAARGYRDWYVGPLTVSDITQALTVASHRWVCICTAIMLVFVTSVVCISLTAEVCISFTAVASFHCSRVYFFHCSRVYFCHCSRVYLCHCSRVYFCHCCRV